MVNSGSSVSGNKYPAPASDNKSARVAYYVKHKGSRFTDGLHPGILACRYPHRRASGKINANCNPFLYVAAAVVDDVADRAGDAG